MKILLEKPEYLKLDELDLPDEYPFPYHPEKFTKEEKIVLSRFFTNHNKPVFAIFGLPQEVVGAMFSRYSRTAKSVRRVFLDEFWKSEDLGIQKLGSKNSTREDFEKARERTKNFYRRVFAEYGDDSVIQMGSVHIAFEYVSQIAIKAIEDQRVASAYIEKSTRYVDFSNKVSGRFLFADVFEIKDTPYEKDFLKWNNCAYRSYVKSLPIARKYFRKKFPLEEYTFVDSVTGESVFYKDISDVKGKERARRAYERALRARSFDSIRLFLPLTMVSNLGAHYSGQAVEHTINKMLSSPNQEVLLVGSMAF
jgi:thymidylate synthase ThyX